MVSTESNRFESSIQKEGQEKEKRYEKLTKRVAAVKEVLVILNTATFEETSKQTEAKLNEFLKRQESLFGIDSSGTEDKAAEISKNIKDTEELFREMETRSRRGGLRNGEIMLADGPILKLLLLKAGIAAAEFKQPKPYEDTFDSVTTLFYDLEDAGEHSELCKQIDTEISRLRKLANGEKPEKYLAWISNERKQRLEALKKQLKDAESADQVLIKNLRLLVAEMKKRRLHVEAVRKGEAEPSEVSNRYDLYAKNIVSREFHPFFIDVFLGLDEFNKDNIDSVMIAFHDPGTPYNFFKKDQAFPGDLKHEQMHALLDTTPETEWQSALAIFSEKGNNFLDEEPEFLIDTSRNEILAQIFVAEDEVFGSNFVVATPNSKLNAKGSFSFSSKENYRRYASPENKASVRFIQFLACMGTAGMDFTKIDNALHEKKSDEERAGNLEKARAIENWQKNFRHSFINTMTAAEEALTAAKELGDEAVEEIHAVMLVLKPSQYASHLLPYLAERFGKEKVTVAKTVAGLLNTFDLSSLRSFENIKKDLSPDQRQKIANKFKKFLFRSDFAEISEKTSLDELQEFISLTREIGKELSVAEESEKIIEGATWHYLFSVIIKAERDPSFDLMAFETALTHEEKNILDKLKARSKTNY